MSFEENRIKGVVILPIAGLKNNILEMLTILPQSENNTKRGEMCPLIPGSIMEPLAGMSEFPGGAVEENEDVLMAARREFESEARFQLDHTFEDRFSPIFEDLPVDQQRPHMAYFAVVAGLFRLNETEILAMENMGARRILVDLANGSVTDKVVGKEILLRPAHRAIIHYVTSIARSLVNLEEPAYV